MADLGLLGLAPPAVETGTSGGGAGGERFIRTDEGAGGGARHFVYRQRDSGLTLTAAGATRREAAAQLGRADVVWAPAGDRERAAVSSRRRQFLHAYVEALFGHAEIALTIEEITDNALAWIAQVPASTRRELSLAVWLLERLLGSDFAASTIERRQRRIIDRLDDFGGLFRDLGKLRTLFYSSYFKNSRAWPAIGFVPPQRRPGAPPLSDVDELRMSPLASTESCDWLIVGSGAGGAAAAAALAARGDDVLVVERGDYYPARRLSHDDTGQYARIYIDGGLQTTIDRVVSVMQARVVGGSSLMNNCICFRLSDPGWTHPDAEDVIGAWESEFGLRFDRAALERAFDHLETELGVHEIGAEQAGANGAHLLGAWQRWLDGPFATPADRRAPARHFKMNFGSGERRCWGCGYCNSGCPYFRKNTVTQTLLVDAQRHGARIVSNAVAMAVNFGDPQQALRRARSVSVRYRGRRRIVPVRKGVIVAAGVGASTALLQASGIESGRRVTCNLACTVAARMPREMNSWQGAQMATYIDRGTHLIESWFHPPATFAAGLGGWFEQHLSRMADYSRLVCAGVVIPTTAGRVAGDKLEIRLSDDELRKLRGHIVDVARLHFAGGAEEVFLPDQTGASVTPADDVVATCNRVFRRPSDFVMVTAHPQGGNPMGRNAQLGTVGANLRVHGCRNLFVADASVFPGSIRVNPQLAIMAFAHANFAQP